MWETMVLLLFLLFCMSYSSSFLYEISYHCVYTVGTVEKKVGRKDIMCPQGENCAVTASQGSSTKLQGEPSKGLFYCMIHIS